MTNTTSNTKNSKATAADLIFGLPYRRINGCEFANKYSSDQIFDDVSAQESITLTVDNLEIALTPIVGVTEGAAISLMESIQSSLSEAFVQGTKSPEFLEQSYFSNISASAEALEELDESFDLYSRHCDGSTVILDACGLADDDLASISKIINLDKELIEDRLLVLSS